MKSLKRKKVEKLYNRLDKLAVKGKDSIMDYYKLIDELLENGEYSYLEDVFIIYYNLDITKYRSVQDVKDKTWDVVLFQTNTTILKKLKLLLDSKNVYQTGLYFYDNSNVYLGKINEIDTFEQGVPYYSESKILAKNLGKRRTYLEVSKINATQSLYIDTVNPSLSEDQNLVNRYSLAVDYLNDIIVIDSELLTEKGDNILTEKGYILLWQ